VSGRQRDDDFVGRRRGAQRRHQDDRPEQADQADAARLHRDELAVRGQAAEADEDPQQDGHGNRDAQRLRQEHVERAQNRRPRDAAGHQRGALLEKRRDLQQKRQDDESQDERQHHLANEIAVEGREHAACLD